MNKVITALITLLVAAPLLAQSTPVRTTVGTWKESDGKRVLVIEIFPHLTPRQTSLINSGFSTFSMLTVKEAKKQDSEKAEDVLAKISCTVKFDPWQEWYDIARIDTTVQTSVAKEILKYADLCLNVRLSDGVALNNLAATGGDLIATLLLDQISVEKASEIKAWLIRQQSGVMQGLFSHMLGALKLSERIDIVVQVPAYMKISKSPPPKGS